MIKRVLIILSVVTIGSGLAFAGGHELVGKTPDYSISVTFDRNPPVAGGNNIMVAVVDKQGRNVTNANLEIYYFMPAMPAMNYTSKAEISGDRYAAVIDLVMAGQWQADVRFATPDGPTGMVSFLFDVK